MKLKDAIQKASRMRPNAFAPETFVDWINEVEGRVQTEVLLWAIEECKPYDWATDQETELLAHYPHDKIYYAYILAMMELDNHEYDNYNNQITVCNEYFAEYARWYSQRYRPADTYKEPWKGYYFSAYGIAVKHGFVGTEEEWLKSLKGDPFTFEDFTPEQLASLRFKYEDFTPEQLADLTRSRESSQTIKQDEQIPEITSPETLRTYFYNLRKSDSRKWQFELSPGGIHENIIEALGGRPEGVPEADKAFLYTDIPYSEAGGFIIKATFEGRDKPILYKKSIFGTLDSRWQDTGWIEQKPQKKEILLVTCEQTEPDRYTVDHSSSEINDFAAAGGLPVLRYKTPLDESAYNMGFYTYDWGTAERFGSDPPAVFVRQRTRNDASNCPILGKFAIFGRRVQREDMEYRVRDDDGLSNLLLPEALISRDPYKVPIFGQDGRNGWSLLKLVDDNMRGPYTTYSSQKIEEKIVRSAFAVCYDEAAPGSFAPNKWYIPQTSPKPSMETGMMIDVLWKKGCEDGIGYDVKLIWGEPGGADNELLLDETGTTDKLTGEHGIPAEGTVRYQLVETNGRKHWEYVSGPLTGRQFSTPSAAAAKNKIVPDMELAYLPGQEIFVQMDNGNTADLMWIVPDAGPTLPVYGNGTGTKTGAIPAGYILQLKNGGDHWQIINGGGIPKPEAVTDGQFAVFNADGTLRGETLTNRKDVGA